MIYKFEEAKIQMEKILDEKVDESFIRRYLDEHDCILIEDKRSKKNDSNKYINSAQIQPPSNKKNKLNIPTNGNRKKRKKPEFKERSDKKNSLSSQLKYENTYDLTTRNELIENHLYLVRKMALYYKKKFLVHKVDYEDLVSEGVFGLIKAVDEFNSKKRFKFENYAVPLIRQAMVKAIIKQGTTVRVPIHVVDQIRRVKRIEEEHIKRDGQISLNVVTEALHLSNEEYQNLKIIEHRFLYFSVSLDSHLLHKEDLSQLGSITEEKYNLIVNHQSEYVDPLEYLLTKEKNKLLKDLYKNLLIPLKEREREILCMRLGLIDGEEKTLEEIGNKFNLTRERIRQIVKKQMQLINAKRRSKKVKEMVKEYFE